VRLCNFRRRDAAGDLEAGVVAGESVLPLHELLGAARAMPLAPGLLPDLASLADRMASHNRGRPPVGLPLSEIVLGPPVHPVQSFRDFYAFEEHVRAARARRGLEMVPEWYEAPAFYFSNPAALLGAEAVLTPPRYGTWLDYELEIGCVIGRGGKDIDVSDAERHIAGYTIINDWSLRDVQRREMKVGLGPAKAKDFATSVGPTLVTADELGERRDGKGYDLGMRARVNGKLLSHGNWKTIHFSFAEMIAHASRGVALLPGDLLGSGTVGTGCLLELGPEVHDGWLRPGDEVELEVELLGVLRNRIGGL